MTLTKTWNKTMIDLKREILYATCPRQVFLAFPAADADFIRMLATGEKACIVTENAMYAIQKRKDLMANRKFAKLSHSLYNPKGIGYDKMLVAHGVPYAGDLRRYRHILDLCIKGSGDVPDYREHYADIMDAYDEEIDPMLQKLRYVVTNECYSAGYKEAVVITELTLANLMCNIASMVCDMFMKMVKGNEYILCADPTDDALHNTDPLLTGYRTLPMRSDTYAKWYYTLDQMVGILAPKGVNLRKNPSIDIGIEAVLKRLYNINFAQQNAKACGVDTEWMDKDNAAEFGRKMAWWRMKK